MKNLIKLILLLVSLPIFAQKSEMDSIYEKLKNEAFNVRDVYDRYITIYNQPNNYFRYYTTDENGSLGGYYIKKTYNSLTLSRLPDSIVLEKSRLKIESNNILFWLIGETIIDFKQYNFLVYNKSDELIGNVKLDDDNKAYEKNDFNNLVAEYYYYGDDKYFYKYKYTIYKKRKDYFFDELIYEKRILQDGTVKIYDYKKDFPVSDEEFLKKVPNIFAEQSTELLKDGTKVKNFNKNTAKNISLHMLGAIIKAGDDYKYNYKYEFQKGYSVDDPLKPVYSFKFFMPGEESWTLGIDPKTEKITYISYGKGFIY